jgi:preprotein translocase subunit SecD
MTSGHGLSQSKKAGLSGLFRYGSFAAVFLLAMAGIAAAEPLPIEMVRAEAGTVRETGQPIISFKMSEASKKAFAELTRDNVGRKMEIRVDGQAMSAPVIREPITGGSGQIVGQFTQQQASDMAARLSSGASKLEVEIVD